MHKSLVGKRVLLGLIVDSLVSSLDITEDGLNLIGVDDSSKISTLHGGSVEGVTLLLGGGIDEIAKDGVERSESRFGEDNKSTEVTTGSELQYVESVDVADINTGDVSGSLGEVGFVVVDKEGTLSHDVSRVSVFANTSSDFLGRSNLGEVIRYTEFFKNGQKLRGLLGSIEAFNNHWEFSDVLNGVSTSHNKRSASRGGESGGNSVSSLVDVALSMPLSPDLERSEHSGLSSHVTEGSLTGSRGTRT